MIYLFLDDIRQPQDCFSYLNDFDYIFFHWNVVRNYNDFVKFINVCYNEERKLPDVISFDHDLADQHYRPSMFNNPEKYSGYYSDGTFTEKTGYDCVKYIIEFCLDKQINLPKCKIHTQNPVGKDNMKSLINNFEKACNQFQ